MNLLLRNTILSKNLCGLIYKYYDNSFGTLYKNYNKNKSKMLLAELNPNITLKDLLAQSLIFNRSGFWILKNHEILIKLIDKLIIKEKAKNYIKRFEGDLSIIYSFECMYYNTGPIYKLNCWI